MPDLLKQTKRNTRRALEAANDITTFLEEGPMNKSYKMIKLVGTPLGMLEGFKSDVEELRDEMVEHCENMEGGGLEHTDKYRMTEEARDLLENIDNVPDWEDEWEGDDYLGTKEHEHGYWKIKRKGRAPSRAARLANAIMAGECLVGLCEDVLGEHSGKEGEVEDDTLTNLEAFKDELQSVIEEVQNVEFPGMYG